MYFDKASECMSRDELTRLQLERLQSTLYRLSRNVPFYRKKFEALNLDVEDLRSLEDVRRLPFTTKEDLRANYPYDMFAVPLREVVRLHASSGTTGKAVVVGYTKNDVRRWAKLAARVLVAGGVTEDDVVQIAFGYGLFTGGFGFHYGAEMLGASVVPSSSGNTRRQIQIIEDYKTTALICTPGYANYLADAMRAMDVNVGALPLKRGLFGGEVWSETMRQRIQDGLHLTATDNYGLSEIMGPGVAGECLERRGLHINEDHFMAEVVDPETLEPVEPGQEGELVLTTLTKEAFPMLRFRTGDLTRLLPGDCPCGRTFVRMERISGRTDDMFILKGVNVYPQQVAGVLAEVLGTEPCFQIVLEREGSRERGTVLLEAETDEYFDEIKKHQQACQTIRSALDSILGVGFDVRIVERTSLYDGEACKLVRVVDRREI
ncbi:phenylacetate--CoA ligase family protein [Desulfocurvus sp. DL9XJH121]